MFKMEKEKTNSKFEYTFDFSQNGYFDEEKDKDAYLDSLIREALKESENQSKDLQIDAERIKKFSIIKQKLYSSRKQHAYESKNAFQ